MFLILFAVLVLIAVGVGLYRINASAANPQIAVGAPLPTFSCQREDGSSVSSAALRGHKSVLLFVRGSWCPFCSEQVQAITDHYRKITEQGGQLIIVTRKPLDITQRVAKQFGVAFEFWLDENLKAATLLKLVDEENIPERFQNDFGKRTILPTILVTDRDNNIRYSYRSSNPSDRPDPARFMSVFDAID